MYKITKNNKIFFILLLGFFPCIILAADDMPKNTAITLTMDGTPKYYITTSDISDFTDKSTTLFYDPTYVIEIEKDTLCIDPKKPCLLTASTRESFTVRNKTKQRTNDAEIEIFVEDIARAVDTDPHNAKLKFDDETNEIQELTTHIDGIAIDITETVSRVSKIINNSSHVSDIKLEIPHNKINATITNENARKIGIKKILGKGTSNFAGSTKSRIHNIATAAKRFDGLVIAPNEEFSFVSILGPVDGEHGYEEELVIRDNETKPEYGGGICQVSTTVFRGAIYTGMKITQRRNHSYPVHYYTPTGFDATVYIPAPDFRFINNTPGYVLLNMEIEGTQLIFKYYGTDDGRTTVMDGPYVTDRQDNGAMKTFFTQVVTDKSGEILIDDIFKSNYKSPDDYPHPDDVAKLTKKPDNWSKSQWKDYKQKNGI